MTTTDEAEIATLDAKIAQKEAENEDATDEREDLEAKLGPAQVKAKNLEDAAAFTELLAAEDAQFIANGERLR